MRRLSSILWIVFLAAILAAGLQWLTVTAARDPEDLPRTPLDLSAPVGLFTGAKLSRLGDDAPRCIALMRQAEIAFTALPARDAGPNCGYDAAVRLRPANGLRPTSATLSCPMGASVAVWLREVVQPAAEEVLGSRVVATEDYGSYACRRIYGGSQGSWSQHARANALDIAAFRLADGRRITVARDWREGPRGRFLHRVRDGACRLFATTLSPDYNTAHRDHLHLDQAPRGGMGWRMCG